VSDARHHSNSQKHARISFSHLVSGFLVATLCGLLAGCVGQGPIPGAFGGGGTSGGGTPSSGGSGGSSSAPITLSSSSLSFGQNGVGATSASQTLTLTNSSSATITFNSISASNPAFILGDKARKSRLHLHPRSREQLRER
jgi:hypothetical protein